MTVADIRKCLKGLDGNLPVVIADHDHGTFEFNGNLGSVYVREQTEEDKLTLDKEFHKDGKYVVLRVG